jgi:hypothetical protein
MVRYSATTRLSGYLLRALLQRCEVVRMVRAGAVVEKGE